MPGEEGVDRAILEVGLEGRLDSTNVVEAPEACVVTTVELEHTAILGSTRAARSRARRAASSSQGRIW